MRDLDLRKALELDRPYEAGRATAGGRASAVLVLVAPEDGAVLLTRRAETLPHHKGQIAFPGGVIDETDEGPVEAALREAREEVGLDPALVEVVGRLPELATVTGFVITPVVARLRVSRGELRLRGSPDEIAELFWAEGAALRAPETYRREWFEAGAFRYPIDVYAVGRHRVWGATGSILKNLLDRLEAVGAFV